MSKIYRYEKLTYTGDENEIIVFKVKMISNGNIGRAIIDPPSGPEQVIIDSGKVTLGPLKTLIKSKTDCYSNINNPTPIADSIIVEYYINSTLLLRHENLKTETEDPFIILKIKFIKL
jgi:hypothetical protein